MSNDELLLGPILVLRLGVPKVVLLLMLTKNVQPHAFKSSGRAGTELAAHLEP